MARLKLAYKLGLAGAVSVWTAGVVCYHTQALDSSWLSSMRAVRFGRAAYAAFRVSFDYKWTLRNLEYGTEDYNTVMKELHIRSALRLRDMCSCNGGLFIKVGQHVGSLDYLLPPEYVSTFKLFHNEAPQTPLHRLKKVIEDEMNRPADDVFSELSPEPLGAASLAQCHKGMLKDSGQVVAVKIQHPDVNTNAYTDLESIQFLVHCVYWLFPDFRFQWLVDEIRQNLPKELDFRHEASNQDRFIKLFHHLDYVKAPRVYWALTTKRVLTMEYFEGAKINNLNYIRQHDIDVDDITLKLGRMYSEMIFLRGFIHCDPHPGNVLVRKGPKGGAEIIMLDHGLYQELTDDFRLNYCRLWQALIDRDREAIRRYCLKLNAGEKLYRLLACMITARSWENVEGGITNSKRTKIEMQKIQAGIPLYLAEITQLLDNVPRQLVLILKTNDLLRGVEHVLGSSQRAQSYITMSKYCVRAIGDYEVNNMERSWKERWTWRLRTNFLLLTVYLYEVWVWFKAVLAL